MMEAAGTKSAKLLETQIDMILHVRSAWQQLDAAHRSYRKGREQMKWNKWPSALR